MRGSGVFAMIGCRWRAASVVGGFAPDDGAAEDALDDRLTDLAEIGQVLIVIADQVFLVHRPAVGGPGRRGRGGIGRGGSVVGVPRRRRRGGGRADGSAVVSPGRCRRRGVARCRRPGRRSGRRAAAPTRTAIRPVPRGEVSAIAIPGAAIATGSCRPERRIRSGSRPRRPRPLWSRSLRPQSGRVIRPASAWTGRTASWGRWGHRIRPRIASLPRRAVSNGIA